MFPIKKVVNYKSQFYTVVVYESITNYSVEIYSEQNQLVHVDSQDLSKEDYGYHSSGLQWSVEDWGCVIEDEFFFWAVGF
jgi:hypothetical protein